MELTLFQSTLLAGVLLIALGALFASTSKRVTSLVKSFPRSRLAAYVTMGLGGAWTLYEVANLGEANYGEYRQYIFVAFALIGLLSLIHI